MVSSALLTTQAWYRRELWDEQDSYVEIWLEQEALAGALVSVTEEWDVPQMVTWGYPSISYLYSAFEKIKDQNKPTFLYYFGEHDPNGVAITRCVDEGLRELAPDADNTFQRTAVTEEQIDNFNLQTRPTKTTDSRSKGFGSESVEIDAIPAATLRSICNECIQQHVDQERLDALRTVEEEERETLGRSRKSTEGLGSDHLHDLAHERPFVPAAVPAGVSGDSQFCGAGERAMTVTEWGEMTEEEAFTYLRRMSIDADTNWGDRLECLLGPAAETATSKECLLAFVLAEKMCGWV